ncbi:MAG: aspartate aminotransferase family protein [Anaerolineae bacterium]|nr:aspartate aminotransferase family protein [Anaerolineae bacterium]NUQ06834.1 aspartate aminotransferase family protein [Anaerolineae bacterium]
MTAPIRDNAALQELDKRQLHPLQHPKTHADPLVIERGEGVYLYTADGRKILDGMAGLWNVNVGYGREALAQAAYDQMKRMAFTSNFAGMTNVPAVELAARLSGYAYADLKTTFFTSGGSESNDSAFKIARYYWKRQGKPEKFKIIARKLAYHGITLAATFATGIERYHKMFGPAVPGFVHVAPPYPYRFEGEIKDGETVGAAAARLIEEAILREGADTVAAVIAEPVQGVGGVIVPPDDYFPRVRAICDRHGVLLIADEVITGFGRTGELFGLNRYGVQPDILSFAKAITSGYLPLGGNQISDAIYDTIQNAPDTDSFMHGYTYSGHATACAVGLRNLQIIEEENLVERARAMGARLRSGLDSLAEFSMVGEVRSLGLICGVELVADKTAKTADPALAAKVTRLCQDRGLRTRNVGSTLAFAPPLTITEDEVDEIVRILGSVLDTL